MFPFYHETGIDFMGVPKVSAGTTTPCNEEDTMSRKGMVSILCEEELQKHKDLIDAFWLVCICKHDTYVERIAYDRCLSAVE